MFSVIFLFRLFVQCQDRRFPRDEYAGRCVAAPNMSTPGQQQPPSNEPNTKPAQPVNPSEGQGQEQDGEEEEGNNELDSAVCGEGARLILRPQGCATALNPPRHPDNDNDDDDDNDHPNGDHDGSHHGKCKSSPSVPLF